MVASLVAAIIGLLSLRDYLGSLIIAKKKALLGRRERKGRRKPHRESRHGGQMALRCGGRIRVSGQGGGIPRRRMTFADQNEIRAHRQRRQNVASFPKRQARCGFTTTPKPGEAMLGKARGEPDGPTPPW